MRIVYDNSVLQSEITVNSENLNYPKDNMKDTRLSRFFRSETNTGLTIDFYNANLSQVFSYCALLNHNLTDRATVKVLANTEYSFSSPPFESTLTEFEGMYIASFEQPEAPKYKKGYMFGHKMFNDFMFSEVTLSTYNYWRVTIDDSFNQNSYIQFGMVTLGDFLQMPGMAQDQSLPTVTKSKKSISNSGQVYGSKKYKLKKAKANFPYISRQEKKDIEAMFDYVENYQPVLMLMYESDLSILKPLYCTLDFDTLEMDRNGNTSLPFKTTFEFEEAF